MDRLADALIWVAIHLLGLATRFDKRFEKVVVNDLTDDVAILPGGQGADFPAGEVPPLPSPERLAASVDP